MSTNTIIGLVVGVVIVVAGGYFLATSGGYSMEDSDVTENEVAVTQDATTVAFTGSFFDLATRGGNYKCEVNSTGAAAGTEGIVYVSGADLRGDFTSVSNGTTVESHMLKKGDTMYMWGGGMPQGITMKVTAMEAQGSPATQGSGVSGTQAYGWDCDVTGANASMFVKPSDVEFMDVGAMMHGGAGTGTGSVPSY